jgi:hypothetical protein
MQLKKGHTLTLGGTGIIPGSSDVMHYPVTVAKVPDRYIPEFASFGRHDGRLLVVEEQLE